MHIIAHWKIPVTKQMIVKCLEDGQGFECDLDRRDGVIYLSRGDPNSSELTLEEVILIRNKYISDENPLPLALHMKSCGLGNELIKILKQSKDNRFVFGFGNPIIDLNWCVFNNNIYDLPMFVEFNDLILSYSTELYNCVKGVWLDKLQKNGEWDFDMCNKATADNKLVCFAPAENEPLWQQIMDRKLYKNDNIIICTDYPEKAKLFFNNI
jgi:hypothetical protein